LSKVGNKIMEFNLVKIENSFNKNSADEEQKNRSISSNNQQTFLKTESISNSSLTFEGFKQDNFPLINKKSSTLREISIGVISAVVSAVVIYFILGIK